jgi:hypothetical protein
VALRVATLAVIGAGYIAIRTTTVESALALRFLQQPSEEQIYRSIGAFRLINHLDVVILVFSVSLLVWGVSLPRLGADTARLFTLVVAVVLVDLAFSLLLQPLPLTFLLGFLAIGLATAVVSIRRDRAARPPVQSGRMLAAYSCIPFMSEILTPGVAFDHVYGGAHSGTRVRAILKRLLDIVSPMWTYSIVAVGTSYTLGIMAINVGYLPDYIKGGSVERIVIGNYHGLEIDLDRRRLLATNLDVDRLHVFSLDDGQSLLGDWGFPTEELENIRINAQRNELYHFDRTSERLRVYDAHDYSLRRESSATIDGGGTAQVEFDNSSKTIIVTRESDFVWLFDMDDLRIVHESAHAGAGNADVLFSEVLRSYVLSYYNSASFLRLLDPVTGEYREFERLPFQNDLQESVRSSELYVTTPIEGTVHAYDLEDLNTLKRSLRTVFGVRAVAYDRLNDVLITASMVNGHADVLDAATGKILDRVFVGYYLREIALLEERREAFISSQIGGVYRLRY